MRLIDADGLRNTLSDKDYLTYTHEYGYAIPFDWIVSAIEHAPTVERPTGKWIRENEVYSKCSFCGFKYADYRILFDFCPHCGAYMSEE